MQNIPPIKKGKGTYLYDIHSNKYYDLRNNSNIIGYSHKKITNQIKDHISASLNIYGDTVYHRRTIRFYKQLFSDNYNIMASFSMIEFISRILQYSFSNQYNLVIQGQRFNDWFCKHFDQVEKANHNKNIIIHDIAEIYLQCSGDTKKFEQVLGSLKKGDLTIYNYYWFPNLDIKSNNADIIIMPSLYSGYFEYINILVSNNIHDLNNYMYSLEHIPSIYLASSLKLYYIIKKIFTNELLKLNWPDINQAGRLFVFDKYDNALYDKYYSNNILLNKEPPYYNYIPIILEDFQKKYLNSSH